MVKGKKRKIISLIVVLVILSTALWTLWANTALVVSELSVPSDRLPLAFDGYRIAQISDLHNAVFGESNDTLLALLESTEPDIIVITGDLLDSRQGKPEDARTFAAAATAIAPVYFVTGNHEAWSPAYPDLEAALIEADVTVLRNEGVMLTEQGQSIRLIGIDDPDFHSSDSTDSAAAAALDAELRLLLAGSTAYTLLLSHRPEHFETYIEHEIDLVFSGHAHGGQFRLPFIGGLIAPDQGFFPTYDAGLFTEGESYMIVSRGLGNSIIPLRFNNRPEIVLVMLESRE